LKTHQIASMQSRPARTMGLKALLLCSALSATAGAAAAETAPSADTAVQEVVVTSQKRAENIQNVPIAVSAFGKQALLDRGITRIDQIATAVPDVQIQDFRGLGQPTFVIRGVALLDFNPNNTPAAGVYVDDIYQSSVVMGSGALFDIDHVEVLKGPQAGLYGRNTTGGAVQIISKQPRIGDESGYFDASYGSYETLHVEAGQSIPLTSTLAARVAFSVDKGWDGWQTSLPSGTKWGAPDKKAFRGELLWKPNDKLTASLKVFYARDDSQLTLATSTAAYNSTGGTCAAVAAGHLDNTNCLTWNQLTRPGAPSAATQSDDGKTTLSQPVNQLHNRDAGATLNVAYDLGFATIRSITGYDHFEFGLKDDFAGAVDDELIQTQHDNINYISEEVRLESKPSSSPLSWIVGGNYAFDRLSDSRYNNISGNTIILNTFGLTPATGELDLAYQQRTQYYGFFGQADYKLTDKLTLSVSGRYSNETKAYRAGNETFPLVNYYIYKNLSADYELKDHFTGKVSAQYAATDDAMVYASIAKGYKSGGFYGGFPTSNANVLPYKEEVVYAYELGAKTRWFDRMLTLNGAIFFDDHRDAQGFSTVENPLVPNQYIYNLTNIGTEHHYGIELEATLHPMKGLTLQASGARLVATVTDSNKTFTGLDGTTIAYQGRPVDFSPKLSGEFLVRYEHDLTQGFHGGVQADYNIRSDLNFAPTNVNQALYSLPGYGILGGRVFVTSPQGWTASLYATNLTGEVYKVAALGDGLGSFQEVFGQPRRIGIELNKSW